MLNFRSLIVIGATYSEFNEEKNQFFFYLPKDTHI